MASSSADVSCWCAVLVLLCVISAGWSKTQKDLSEQKKIQCAATEEGLRQQAIHCLTKGERFFKKYFKRYDFPKFSRCREYAAFGKCVNSLVESCPAVTELLPEEWNTARQIMNCACEQGEENKKSADCVASLNCMEEELNMVYSERCDSTYQHNLKQNTQDDCHFLTEYILCTEGVVRSACGEDVGSLLYLAHKVAAWNTYQCDVARWDGYKGFQYSSSCPRELSQSMDGCMEKSLTAKVLRFKADNDLIPDENKEAVELACGAYNNYLNCLSPLNQSCPTGVQAALEHKNTLRIYLMKMNFYCDPTSTEFLGNIECYQGVLDKGLLDACSAVWTRIQDALENMTAFKYYCTDDSPESLQLKSELDNLRQCYETVIVQQCSEEAGAAMSRLIHRVFTDPLYLRLDYKPDCALHTMESLSKRQHKFPSHPHRHRHKERNRGKQEGRGRREGDKKVKTGQSSQRGSASGTTTGSLHCYLLLFTVFLQHWFITDWSVT